MGTNIDKIFFCPYHQDGIIKKYKKINFKKAKYWYVLKAKKFGILIKRIPS